jgi:glutathione S-transferase
MAIVLYYGSGSPFAWRVQLALEHKGLPYERKVLSFSAGDTRKPEFVALNPRHRVPVIVDGDFVLFESNAIVEYLEDAYPASGARLFPGDARTRALARRLIMEVDNYFDEAIDPLTTQAFQPQARRTRREGGRREPCRGDRRARLFHQSNARGLSAGPLSAADFAFYPVHQLSAALRAQASRSRCRRHADARASRVEEQESSACRSSTRRSLRIGSNREDASVN